MRVSLAAAAALLALGLGLAGCVMPPPGAAPRMALDPVAVESLPGFTGGNLQAGFTAFQESCTGILTLPADQQLGGAGLARAAAGTAGQWTNACTAARSISAADNAAVHAFLTGYLAAYRISANGQSSVQFSGYFEPEVNGSLRRTAHYATPIYGRPHDLVQADLGSFRQDLAGRLIAGRVRSGALVPYFTRSEIVAGALDGQHLEIAWLADPIDALVLEIEGAGRIRLPDGNVVRVAYDGGNGQPYVPIGSVLADRGAIPKNAITLGAILAWLRSHPGDAGAVMDQNPSFVFFRILKGIPPDLGPPGALGVPLAPGRALAVDRNYIPLGAPVWVSTTDPVTGKPWQHLMVAEDIGGAIRTPLRADIFFGWGADAEREAGAMNATGPAYLLLPRPPARP